MQQTTRFTLHLRGDVHRARRLPWQAPYDVMRMGIAGDSKAMWQVSGTETIGLCSVTHSGSGNPNFVSPVALIGPTFGGGVADYPFASNAFVVDLATSQDLMQQLKIACPPPGGPTFQDAPIAFGVSFQFSLGDSYVILSGHSPFGAGQVRWDDVPADFLPTQDTPG